MTFLFWLIVIALVGVVGLGLSRRWEARQQAAQADPAPETPATEPDPGVVTHLTTTLRNGISQLQTNLFGAKPATVAPKLRAWVGKALGNEPQLQHWLAGLSDEQLNVLGQHIATFCQEMGFELNWVLDQELALQPRLAHGSNKIVINYCQACLQAVELQEELEPYRRLRQYEQNPHSRQNREFGQALFGKFAEKGLTAISLADHLALSEPERRQQIIATVRQAATEKPTLVLSAVKELITQSNGVDTAAPTPHVNGNANKVNA